MPSPLMLVFLLGLAIGISIGLYLGNSKFRRAINGMLSRGGDDDGDDYDEE